MSRVLWRMLGLALVAGGGLLTAWLSVAPYRVPGSDRGVLRLAWSARPERIEHCRRLTDAELEGVPAHMRQRVKCEGFAASYRLRLLVDGTERHRDSLTGGGARSDRPIHVLRDLALPAGTHRVEVTVVRIDSVVADSVPEGPGEETGGTALSAAREQREAAERARARREALPAALRFEEDVALAAGEIALLTYDPDTKALRLQRRQSP